MHAGLLGTAAETPLVAVKVGDTTSTGKLCSRERVHA